MCGRFVSSSAPDEIARYFGAQLGESLLEPSYNVAPTNDVFVVLATGETRRLEPMRWGLVPAWAKDPGIGSRMINARAEGLAGKNAYKRAFKRRRCIVPADGFYEWMAVPGQRRKQPFYIHRADGDRLAFAGLWEAWRDPARPDDPPLRTCTVITGPANETVAKVHDRMPVILPPERWDTWLDPGVDDLDLLGTFLVPAPSSIITMHPVSTDVNVVRNKGPELIDPIDPPAAAGEDQAPLW
jgi:putative SOS response-associated peptidase YedK